MWASDLRSAWAARAAWALLLSLWVTVVQGMRVDQIKELRYVCLHLSREKFTDPLAGVGLDFELIVIQCYYCRRDTEHMFYHGFDNYLEHAFPEDELRPLTCGPLVRDRENPAHIALNDVLGNYSLTLIDSLSTLAILSSGEEGGARAWKHFQNGVSDLVRLYGDGSEGPAGQGERARGFDVDSKVQVFETVIRGLGMDNSPCLDRPSCLIGRH